MSRQLAVLKRTDLSFYEGWEGCYVEWQPATYGQALKLIRDAAEDISEDDATKKVIETVKDRIVSGKVRIIENGKEQLVDIETDDVDTMPSVMVDRIFADMTGVKYDADPLEPTPADDESSKATNSTKQQTPTNSSETQ